MKARKTPRGPKARPSVARLATERRQRAFLAAFVTNGVVLYAARAAKVSRSVIYHWRRTDEQFAERFQEAQEDAADALEIEARRRAIDGWQEEVYRQGRLVGTVSRYSDPLLAMLLRYRRPEVFGKRIEVKASSTLSGRLIDPTTSTDAELLERVNAAQALLFGRQK
jgi:hypothetical protein